MLGQGATMYRKISVVLVGLLLIAFIPWISTGFIN